MRSLIILASILVTAIQAQTPEYYSRDDRWYFRKGSSATFLQLVEGNIDSAMAEAHRIGPDREADYIRAIGYAHLGKSDSAMKYLRASLEKNLDFNRYLAGGLMVLDPLIGLPEFQEIKEEYSSPLIHGPALGAVSDRSAGFWLRSREESTARIQLSTNRAFLNPIELEGKTDAEREYTLELRSNDLLPDTHYFYRVYLDNKLVVPFKSFRTHPDQNSPTQFNLAFGGCSAYVPWNERIWSTIGSHSPVAFFTLGDNVYIDYPEHPQVQKYCYYQRQSEQQFRELADEVPFFAIYDDHDFGDNDAFGTPSLDSPAWKLEALEVFKHQWIDPGYGQNGKVPGVYFNWKIADVEFFFLDGRFYREPSWVADSLNNLTMLGEKQKEWLKKSLKESDATFKVLISSVPWAPGAKLAMQGRVDTWDGYPQERQEIFSFLHENEIEGVFLLSADRHRSDIWKIERERGYPLFEFETARLTNEHYHKEMKKAQFSYNDRQAFGKLHFNTLKEDPEVTYEIISIDNDPIHSFTLKLSDLSY